MDSSIGGDSSIGFEPLPGRWAHLAPPGYEDPVLRSLGGADAVGRGELTRYGRLFLPGSSVASEVPFSQNTWLEPALLRFTSITEAARALRGVQRNWWPYAFQLHRRNALIQSKLPHIAAKPLVFPAAAPTAALGSFVLLDEHTMLCSARCSSPFPNGEARFVEDRVGPPNRAYRKLWEAWSLMRRWPRDGERCLDAGASPGGWTWALAKLGARVLAVDRAPLDPSLARRQGIEYRAASAFAIQPRDECFDWIVADMACYPDRLWTWAERWLRSGRVDNLVLTLKFQGEEDHGAIERFQSVSRGKLVHLHHNKHELTFLWPAD